MKPKIIILSIVLIVVAVLLQGLLLIGKINDLSVKLQCEQFLTSENVNLMYFKMEKFECLLYSFFAMIAAIFISLALPKSKKQ